MNPFSRSRLIAIAAALALLGAVPVYHFLAREPRQGPAPNPPSLLVSDADLKVGNVHETNDHDHTLHITNPTDQPVTILRFEKSCDCLAITPDRDVTLQPGQSKSFSIKLALLASYCGPAGKHDGQAFSLRLRAILAAGGGRETPVDWQLKGVIIPTVWWAPGKIPMGTLSDRSAAFEKVVLVEAAEAIGRIDHRPLPFWDVEVIREKPMFSANRFRVTIRPNGRLVPRRIADAIQLTPVTRDGKRLPSKQLPLTGEVVPDVGATPPEIHHGPRQCGTSAEEAVRLRSLTGGTFRVEKVSSSSGDLEVRQVEDGQTGGVYFLRLRFTRAGDQRAVASFLIRHEDGAEYTVAVPVRYQGMQPPGPVQPRN